MKFSPKFRVLCLELKQDRRQLKKSRGLAGKGKRGGLPLHIGLAGALYIVVDKSLSVTLIGGPLGVYPTRSTSYTA